MCFLLKQKDDDSIWGVDEKNSVATRRIGAIHDKTIWEVDATNSVDNKANRNDGLTSQNTNFVSDLTSYMRSKFSAHRCETPA